MQPVHLWVIAALDLRHTANGNSKTGNAAYFYCVWLFHYWNLLYYPVAVDVYHVCFDLYKYRFYRT